MANPLFPPPVKPGDTIGIVAPSGQIRDKQQFESGVHILKDMGLSVRFPNELWPGSGYFSDNDQNRAREFNRTWADPDIKAVIAARGGYGCIRILDRIDLDLIRKTPKLLLGFSDITIFHSYLQQKTGLVSLHGPVVTSLALSDKIARDRFNHCLLGKWTREIDARHIEILRGGPPVQGILVGGNLSSIQSLLGTPFQPDWKDKIVFLEDTGEPFYRLDRMLTQFFYSGMFNGITGLILGDFSYDLSQSSIQRQRLQESVWERILTLTARSGIPVWGDFPIGHCVNNLTLPIGAVSCMDSKRAILSFN